MSGTPGRAFVLSPPSLSAPPSLTSSISLLSGASSLSTPVSSLPSISASPASSSLQNLQSSSFPSWPTRPQGNRISRPAQSAAAANSAPPPSAAAAAAAASSRKRRAAAGEEVDPTKSTVRDLLKTRKHIGKPTRATAEREEARKRGRTNAGANATAGATEDRASSVPSHPAPAAAPAASNNAPVAYAPQLRLVDGKIVLNEESMTVSAASEIPDQSTYDVVYESTNHITSSSYTNRVAPKKWTPEETELFFQALRQCGTDFTMIAKMFPTRTRKQIRYKFKREDKENPQRISNALNHPVPLEAENYAMIAAAIEADGGIFDPPEETTAEQENSATVINETDVSLDSSPLLVKPIVDPSTRPQSPLPRDAEDEDDADSEALAPREQLQSVEREDATEDEDYDGD